MQRAAPGEQGRMLRRWRVWRQRWHRLGRELRWTVAFVTATDRSGRWSRSWSLWLRTSWRLWRRGLQRWERHLARNTVFVLFEPGLPAPPEADFSYRELNLTGGITARTLLASVGLHMLLVATPVPEWLASLAPVPSATPAEIEAAELSTSRVLPPIYPRRLPKRAPSPGGKEGQPLPPRGAEVVQAQTIVSSPERPNHPRQTLLQQFAREGLATRQPDVRLPNMVIPNDPEAVPRSEIDLARVRVPNAPVDLSGPPRAPTPPRARRSAAQLSLRGVEPKNLQPRITLPESASGERADSSSDINLPVGVPRSGELATPGILALSAAPAGPQRRLQLPEENLRARFAAGPDVGVGSPGGVPGGVPGATGGSGGGPGGIAGGGEGLIVPDILVMPAEPVPPGPVIVGPGGSSGGAPPPPAPSSSSSPRRAPREPATQRQEKPSPAPAAAPEKSPTERGRALMEAAQGGGRGSRRVYVTYLYLANLTSQSSSWLVQFAEQETNNPAGESLVPLAPPQVAKKVDPCYPSEGQKERVEGVVVIYGVVRADGRVQDAVVMRGLSAKIDQAALEAFSRSVFQPARKSGRPVDIEVLVEIPFRLAPCQ